MVTVIMSVYKETPKLLVRSIESILNQTFKDIKFIVVLDWPDNQEALELLKFYQSKDNRFSYYVNARNMGQGPSRNYAIGLATGKYIALQDADDYSLPQRLEKQYLFLSRNQDIDVLGTGIIYKDLDTDQELFRRTYKEEAKDVINKKIPCGHPTIMVKKEIFDKYGKYDSAFIAFKEEQTFVEDYELFIRWHLQGVRMSNIHECLYVYYRDSSKIPKSNYMVKSVVNSKKKYLRKLHFTFSDYLYLYMQILLSFLPSKVIAFLFYKLNGSK